MINQSIQLRNSSLMFPSSSSNKKIEEAIRRNTVLRNLSTNKKTIQKKEHFQDLLSFENFILRISLVRIVVIFL